MASLLLTLTNFLRVNLIGQQTPVIQLDANGRRASLSTERPDRRGYTIISRISETRRFQKESAATLPARSHREYS